MRFFPTHVGVSAGVQVMCKQSYCCDPMGVASFEQNEVEKK